MSEKKAAIIDFTGYFNYSVRELSENMKGVNKYQIDNLLEILYFNNENNLFENGFDLIISWFD